MVLLRSSNKVGRKPRVAIGNSKASGGVKTLRPKSGGRSNVDKSPEEPRVSTGESRVDKVNGRKTTRIAGNDLNDKSGGRKKRDFKTRGEGDEGFERVMDVSTGQKRKRTYGGPGIVEERRGDGFKNKRPISESRNGSPRLYSDKGEKKVWVGKTRESEGASRNPMGRSKFKESEVLDKKFRSDKPKRVQENGFGNGMLESRDNRKTKLATSKDLNPRTYATDKPRKYVKKSLVTGSDSKEVLLPKKKKRVMRIDPRDVSNKRMDDGIGNSQAKVDSEENINAELSKNAQFRAIVPSPSILSFVEDNLLGRRRDIDFRRAGYNIQLSAPLDNIPFTTCSERERIEVPVFRNKLEFFAAAKTSSSFPPPDLPEIAFAGRSNVGKSSLLNALTRNWGVARTSDKPGLTQTINFFKLGPKLSLVDLPGYGFAYAKEEVKEAWEELVKEYVTTRVGLKRVCVLVDTKWGMKPRDLELIDLMERSETKYQVVLTKTDTVFPIDVARRAMEIEDSLKANKSAVQPLMMVSSRTGAGIRSLRTVLANIARLVK